MLSPRRSIVAAVSERGLVLVLFVGAEEGEGQVR
jgi:hypothetical protein